MAKQGKVLPARRPREAAEDSLLIRSAESLGRVIGSLQRQLDTASRRMADRDDDMEIVPVSDNGFRTAKNAGGRKKTKNTTTARKRATSAGRTSGQAKAQSATKRSAPRAARSSTAKKTSGTGGSRGKSAARRPRR